MIYIPSFDEIPKKGSPNSFVAWTSDASPLTGCMTITIAKRSSEGMIYRSNNLGRFGILTMVFFKLKARLSELNRLALAIQVVDLLNEGVPAPEVFDYGAVSSDKSWKSLESWFAIARRDSEPKGRTYSL